MNDEREVLTAPTPRVGFAFWGVKARLELPCVNPEVLFDYVGEPPHGDPLYKVTVGSFTLGGWKAPLPCFGRDLHLSPCSGFLALTAIRGSSASYHVVDLLGGRLWSHPGLVKIMGVTDRAVNVSRYAANGVVDLSERVFIDDGRWCELYAEVR